MRVRPLSLLYAAIWLTSTAFALVAHPSSLRARAEATAEYPTGYDSKTCPLDSTPITLHASPARPEALIRPIPRMSTSFMTERALPPDGLSQICRQVGLFPFTGDQGLNLQLETLTVQPGLYVVSATANMVIRALSIYDLPDEGPNPLLGDNLPPPPPAPTGLAPPAIAQVNNNQFNHITVQIRMSMPVRLQILLNTQWPNASGRLAVFKIGPRGYRGPSL